MIDPGRDPRPYRREADRRGLHIALVADTHLHNDFVSGNLELAALGAEAIVPTDARVGFPHRPVGDDDEIEAGRFTLRAIVAPGHTPEHVAYLMREGSAPAGLFSGGSLLRGSVARTDLLGEEAAEELTRAQHATLQRLLELPDDLAVFPTHGAGETYCAVAPSTGDGPRTTIGAERASNPYLALDEAGFAEELARSRGTFPRYFRSLRGVNRGPRAVFGSRTPELPSLSVDRFVALAEEGAEVVDVRRPSAFARGHVPGSLAIYLRPAFASWLGWLVERERPLVFVLDQDQDRDELVRRCLAIGYEELRGELDDGFAAWTASGREARSTRRVEPSEIEGTLVDVRQRREFEAGHVPGALHIELGSLLEARRSLPQGPLTAHCEHGERSMTAASLLERVGRAEVAVMRGGPREWAEANALDLVEA